MLVGLAAVGVVALLALAALGAITLFGSDDSNDDREQNSANADPRAQLDPEVAESDLADETVAAADPAPDGSTEDESVEAVVPEGSDVDEVATVDEAATIGEAATNDTANGEPDVDASADPEPNTTIAPAVTLPDDETADPGAPAADGPEESRAVVRNGQIFLEGAVPTAEAGAEIEALAAEILGPDNVFNNYVVDPGAGDPNIGNITVEDTINFETSSAVILPGSEGLLNQGLALMTIRPAMTITVVGHTDSRGTAESNQILSEQRAESVKSWFVERGVDANRLTTVGAGASLPIADNDTAEGQRLNRRIQFFLENIFGE